MAYIGLPYYGYCPYTTTEAEDGKVTETLGKGKITRSVIKFTPSEESNAVELWAGDLMEQSEYDNPTASVGIERSYISLEEEAALCGQEWTSDGADGGIVHNVDDVPPFCRVAAMAKVKKPDRTVKYRVVGYHRVVFGPVNDELATAQKAKAFGTQMLSGTASPNADGDFKYKNEFDTFELALTDFKKFLNVTE